MNNLLVIVAIIAATSAVDLDLNEMCAGSLFRTLPHPTESNLFIGCVQGKGTVLGCRTQGEIFNQFSVTCGTAELLPSPPVDLCENVIVGWFPDEDDCTRYIVCENSEPGLRVCPQGSVFNRYLPGCVPGNNSTCQFDHHTTPTTTVVTETSTTDIPSACPTDPSTTWTATDEPETSEQRKLIFYFI